MGGSIIDDPTPPASEVAEDAVTLEKLADMLYLVFEAVKDLEEAFKKHVEES